MGMRGTILQRVRGQNVKMKKGQSVSASFKSQTVRQIQREINHAVKLNYPGSQAYSDQSMMIGVNKLEGGAPNNFLLMKNER